MTSLLSRPYMRAGLMPKIDLSGCVFNAPLWRPDLAGSTFYDLAGHNLCTVVEATYGTQGRTSDGVDDRITIPDNATLRFGTGAFTIECWARWIADVSDLYPVFIGKGHNTAGKWKLGTANNASTPEITVYGDGGTLFCQSTGATIDDTNFHHMVFTRSGANGMLYFDGVSVGTQTGLAASNFNATTQLAIADNGEGNGFSKSQVGEVRLYNRALPLTAIQYNYQVTKWRY